MELIDEITITLTLFRDGHSQMEIAKYFGCDPKTVRNIMNRAERAGLVTAEERRQRFKERRKRAAVAKSISQKGAKRSTGTTNIGEPAIAEIYAGRRYNLMGARNV